MEWMELVFEVDVQKRRGLWQMKKRTRGKKSEGKRKNFLCLSYYSLKYSCIHWSCLVIIIKLLLYSWVFLHFGIYIGINIVLRICIEIMMVWQIFVHFLCFSFWLSWINRQLTISQLCISLSFEEGYFCFSFRLFSNCPHILFQSVLPFWELWFF